MEIGNSYDESMDKVENLFCVSLVELSKERSLHFLHALRVFFSLFEIKKN